MLVEINNQIRKRINLGLIKKTVESFLRFYCLNNKEVSLALVDDKIIKKLNKIYRNLNKTTDVLAFSNNNDNFLGEIIINYEQIKKQAKQLGHSVQQELIFILIHGLLHLIGYDDKTEKGLREMDRLGKDFIKLKI